MVSSYTSLPVVMFVQYDDVECFLLVLLSLFDFLCTTKNRVALRQHTALSPS